MTMAGLSVSKNLTFVVLSYFIQLQRLTIWIVENTNFLPVSSSIRTSITSTFLLFRYAAAASTSSTAKAWHHIVEQNPSNIANFGAQRIHNTENLIWLEHGAGTIHAKVSGYYSSKQLFTNGQTVRQWLSTQSYKEQYEFGIKALKQFG